MTIQSRMASLRGTIITHHLSAQHSVSHFTFLRSRWKLFRLKVIRLNACLVIDLVKLILNVVVSWLNRASPICSTLVFHDTVLGFNLCFLFCSGRSDKLDLVFVSDYMIVSVASNCFIVARVNCFILISLSCNLSLTLNCRVNVHVTVFVVLLHLFKESWLFLRAFSELVWQTLLLYL